MNDQTIIACAAAIKDAADIVDCGCGNPFCEMCIAHERITALTPSADLEERIKGGAGYAAFSGVSQ